MVVKLKGCENQSLWQRVIPFVSTAGVCIFLKNHSPPSLLENHFSSRSYLLFFKEFFRWIVEKKWFFWGIKYQKERKTCLLMSNFSFSFQIHQKSLGGGGCVVLKNIHPWSGVKFTKWKLKVWRLMVNTIISQRGFHNLKLNKTTYWQVSSLWNKNICFPNSNDIYFGEKNSAGAVERAVEI